MRVVERDRIIMREIARNGYMTGKQIMLIAGFGGTRATDRRLKKLMDQGWLNRDKKLYGLCGLYTVTAEGMEYFGLNELLRTTNIESINLNEIEHNLAAIDSQIYFIRKHSISLEEITTDKEIRRSQGLQIKQHVPDFVINKDGKSIAVEIERTYKGKVRLQKNIEANYTKYDAQYWIVPVARNTIREILQNLSARFPGIEIFELEAIQTYVEELKDN